MMRLRLLPLIGAAAWVSGFNAEELWDAADTSSQMESTPAPEGGLKKDAVEKIGSVLEVIQDLVNNVQSEIGDASRSLAGWQEWAKDNVKQCVGKELEALGEIAQINITIEQLAATAIEQAAEIVNDTATLSDAIAASQKASAVRNKRNKQYEEADKNHKQIISRIGDAVGHLDKNSLVFGTLDGLATGQMHQMDAGQDIEQQQLGVFNKLDATLVQQIASLRKGLREKKAELADKDLTLIEKKSTRDQFFMDLNDAVRICGDLNSTNASKTQEHDVREAGLVAEKQALLEAVGIVSESLGTQEGTDNSSTNLTFSSPIAIPDENISSPTEDLAGNDDEIEDVSFVQVRRVQSWGPPRLAAAATAADGTRRQAAYAMRGSRTAALLQAGTHVNTGGGHGGSNEDGGLEAMVEDLKDEADDELKRIEQKEKDCKRDMAEVAATLQEKNNLHELAKADAADKNTTVLEHDRNIARLKTELAKFVADQAAATKERQSERGAFKKGNQERGLALKVLPRAVQRLQDAYKEKAVARGGAVIVLLENVVAGINATQQEAAATEEKAEADFDMFQKDLQKSSADASTSLIGVQQKRASLSVKLETKKDDVASLEAAIEALAQQKEAERVKCEQFLTTFERDRDRVIAESEQYNRVLGFAQGFEDELRQLTSRHGN